MVQFNLTQLLVVFDQLLPLTDEEQKIYWLQRERADGFSILLCVSAYEDTVDISISYKNEVVVSSVSLKPCFEINVLEENRKSLEVLSGKGNDSLVRCFLSLDGDTILEVESSTDRSTLRLQN